MKLDLMIEGQEGVSWADWLAVAQACERHGILSRAGSTAARPRRGGQPPWNTRRRNCARGTSKLGIAGGAVMAVGGRLERATAEVSGAGKRRQ